MAVVFGEGSGAVAKQQEGGDMVRHGWTWPFFRFV